MTANDILIDAFERIKQNVHKAVKGLGEEQLAQRPSEDANSIAWLIWHLTRVQDDHLAELIGDEQIWTSAGWAEKFDLPFDTGATGYGHTPDEVGLVQASADQLTGYYDAVHDATTAYIKSLEVEDFDRVVDDAWDPPVTLGVRLVSVVNDDMQHVGQAAYVRGLIE
jgi:uncharacterized damage-inducible protein DinB